MTSTSGAEGAAPEPTITLAEADEATRRERTAKEAAVAHTHAQLLEAERGVEAAERKVEKAAIDAEAAELAREHAAAELEQKRAEHEEALAALGEELQ